MFEAMSGRVWISLFSLLLLLISCGDSGSEDPQQEDPNVTAEMKAKAGQSCVAACGAADPAMRCAVPLTDPQACGGGWCLVDHQVKSSSFTYCTYDCSQTSCPTGYSCNAVDVIGLDGLEQACTADPPVCGDKIKQRDEVCERGESSSEGQCKDDCSGWASQCGDGVKQPSEVCDGDTEEAYCIKCQELKPPSISVTNMSIQMISDTYNQWTHSGSVGSLTAVLPTAGDANGCGSFKVVEDSAELVRIELTHCSTSTNSRATWGVAFPRKSGKWSDSSYDAALRPTAKMEKLNTPSGSLSFGKSAVVRTFDGDAMLVGPTLFGKYTIELIIWGMGEGRKAKLSFGYTLLPPPRS